MKKLCALLTVTSLSMLQCGKNQDILTPGGALQSPQNIMAYSADRQSVAVTWTAPAGATDSLFGGYLIEWNGGKDSVGKNTFAIIASGLPQGVSTFLAFSRLLDGTLSTSGGTIRWAPAERFSNATYQINQYILGSSVSGTAVALGTSGGSPTAVNIDDNTGATADFYLRQGTGQSTGVLQLWAADQFSQAYNQTRFSTVIDTSTTLDFPRASFPSSFTEPIVTVSASTIYYLQLVGPNNTLFYARILILSVSPSNISFQVSLQRAQGVQYADAGAPDIHCPPAIRCIPPPGT